MEVKDQYQVKISNRFAAFENFDDDNDGVDISRAWESIRKHISGSHRQSSLL
jgi:GTP cyclohydrolase FolE2